MKYNFAAVSLILFVFLFAADSYSQPFRHGGKQGWRDGCRFDRLNLSEDQQKKVDALREDHWNEVGKLHDELDKMRIDQRSMMRSDNLNRSDYLNNVKKMSDLREKIALSGAEFRMDVYELLNDEQKKDFNKMGFNEGRGNRAGAFFRNNRRGFCR